MKKILFALAFMFSVAYGQTYAPNLHTVTNKALGIAQANPTDARSYYYDPSLFIYRPYQSTAEVIGYLNLPKYRTGQFSILVNSGGTLNPDGTFSGGTIVEYWFKDGVADINLVVKSSVTTSDTTNWNTAYRKRPVSLIYDSTSQIASLTLGDGTVLSDTILYPIAETAVLVNGSSTVGDSLLVSNVGGDTAWIKNALSGNVIVENVGDTVLKYNVDSLKVLTTNLYDDFRVYANGRSFMVGGDMSSTEEGYIYTDPTSVDIGIDTAGVIRTRLHLYKSGGLRKASLEAYENGITVQSTYAGLDKKILVNVGDGKLNIDTLPFYGPIDTALYWNQSTHQVMRGLVSGGGGSGTVTQVNDGYGISGGPITTTGTLAADTSEMTTKNDRMKLRDSLVAIYDDAADVTGSVQFNSGGNLAGDGAKFFWDNTNKRLNIGSNSPTSDATITSDNIGTATQETDGVTLANNTAAADGAQQRSPNISFIGQGWKTSATAASQRVYMRNFLLPVQGTTEPSYQLTWEAQIGSGSRFTPLVLGTNGLRIQGMNGGAGGLSFAAGQASARTILSTSNLAFSLSSTATSPHYRFASTSSITSGVDHMLEFSNAAGLFNPTSGTGEFHVIAIYPNISQTGGASGVTSAIKIYNEDLSAADFRAIQADTGKVMFNGGLYLRSQPAAVTTGNYTVGGDENFIYLPDLTTEAASRNVVMPSTGMKGRILYVFNTNSDATYKWSFSTTTVEDAAGAAVTTLTDQKCYTLYFYGSTWKVLSVQ